MQEIELQQRCTAFQELTKDEQYRLIQELLAKRNDPEAQQLLDRYIELFYAMHKSKTETKKEKRAWRLSMARVVIGLAGCLVLVVPVAAKCHSLWKEHHQLEVDPGYTLDGSETIPDLYQEEHFESVEALRERYPTIQLPTVIPDGYTLQDAMVARTSGSIRAFVAYENQDGFFDIDMTQYNPKLSGMNARIEYDYGSQQYVTKNGISYCFATNIDENIAMWTVPDKEFDKFYYIGLPKQAGDIKEIVFSFE